MTRWSTASAGVQPHGLGTELCLCLRKYYCEEALALCDKNKSTCTNGNFNLLFEQMLFALKARKEGRQVSTVFPKVFADNGYTVEEFCQLDKFDVKPYFHLLGGHKRNPEVIKADRRNIADIHFTRQIKRHELPMVRDY